MFSLNDYNHTIPTAIFSKSKTNSPSDKCLF